MGLSSWRTQQWLRWLALAATLLGALAPTVSQALAAQRGGGGLIEVCTSQGPRWISADPATARNIPGADSTDGQESAFPFDHCPFCLHVAERLGPPPAASLHFFNAESGLAWPDVQAPFFPTVGATAALPRGPPGRPA